MQASGEVGGLPDTLRGLVAARLDELSIDERNMLENAAVLGSWGTWQGLVEFGRALDQTTTRDTLVALVEPRARSTSTATSGRSGPSRCARSRTRR